MTNAALDRRTEEVTRIFHALSDPTRLEILRQLMGGEHCVCELTGALEAAQSRLSFHLRTLRDAGLVTDRRDGRWVYYTVNEETLAAAQALLETLKPDPDAVPQRQGCC